MGGKARANASVAEAGNIGTKDDSGASLGEILATAEETYARRELLDELEDELLDAWRAEHPFTDDQWKYISCRVIVVHDQEDKYVFASAFFSDPAASQKPWTLRQMFHELNATTERNLVFHLLGTVLQPIPADIYLPVSRAPRTKSVETEPEVPIAEFKDPDWLSNFVSFYRGLGFLQSTKSVEQYCEDFTEDMEVEGDVLEPIIDDIDEWDDLLPNPGAGKWWEHARCRRVVDMEFLAALDPSRVWWRWRSYDYVYNNLDEGPPAGAFAALVTRLAHISQGRLAIAGKPRERPGTSAEQVIVELEVGGVARTLSCRFVREQTKWGDAEYVPCLDFVDQVSGWLDGDTFKFYTLTLPDEEYLCDRTSFVIMLSDRDVEAIRDQRKWTWDED